MDATRLVERFYIGSAPDGSGPFSYIAFCAQEFQPTSEQFPDIVVHLIPLLDNDDPISPEDAKTLWQHADTLASAWRQGHHILVTCIMGRNRSALLSTLALSRIFRLEPRVVAARVQELRTDPTGVSALQNPVFWEFLQSIRY